MEMYLYRQILIKKTLEILANTHPDKRQTVINERDSNYIIAKIEEEKNEKRDIR